MSAWLWLYVVLAGAYMATWFYRRTRVVSVADVIFIFGFGWAALPGMLVMSAVFCLADIKIKGSR